MRNNYVLIDYESVQPKTLAGLEAEHFRVYLFLGQHQTKLSVDVVTAMHNLGTTRGVYVRMSGTGPNALDFHIAFYMGLISIQDPTAYFHIISRDTGFDPLLAHLKDRQVSALRSKDIADIPLLKAANTKSLPEKIDLIVANLQQRGTSRPRSVKTLFGTISSLFQKQLGEDELASILAELQRRKIVSVNATKVAYSLADSG